MKRNVSFKKWGFMAAVILWWSSNEWINFALCKMQVISILGLAPYYIASRIFAKIKNSAFANVAYRTMHTELSVVPSAHSAAWFLGCHRLHKET